MEFELSYTAVQEEFRSHVRSWLVENVPDGITVRPQSFEESGAIYLLRRELGRKRCFCSSVPQTRMLALPIFPPLS